MKKEMLINVLQPEECRIAIVEDGVLEELYVERTSHESYIGNIYKGKIVNLEPAIQAAFVDFSIGRNGFLHVSDVEPQYYRGHLTDESEFSPRDRHRDPRRDSPAPKPPRDDPRDRPPEGERERPDLSVKGHRDRSERRRFGEGLADELGEPESDFDPSPSETPGPESSPAQPEAPPVRSEPPTMRSEPQAPQWRHREPPFPKAEEASTWSEQPPLDAPEIADEEIGGWGSRATDSLEQHLPPSRTHRSRGTSGTPGPAPRESDRGPDESDLARDLPASGSDELTDLPGESPSARRGRRGRGRVGRMKPGQTSAGDPVSESMDDPSIGFDADSPGEDRPPVNDFDDPLEGEIDQSIPPSDPSPPRRRGGRAAIRSRPGGDRERSVEPPRVPPRRPTTSHDERQPEPAPPPPPPPRGRDRAPASEPPRERKPHGRAGEPGYVPRRERSGGFGPEDQIGWSERDFLAEPDDDLLGDDAESEGTEPLAPSDPARGRRRRRGRRRETPRDVTAEPSALEGEHELPTLPPPRPRPAPPSRPGPPPPPPPRRPQPGPQQPPVTDFLDFRDEPDASDALSEFDEEEFDDEPRVPADIEDRIDPELEEEIRREIEEIAELEREMGLKATVEARPRRGEDRGPGPRAPAAAAKGPRGRGVVKPPIQEVFRRGDEILIQVIKESIGTKGPTLSTYISIPGRYLVLMPGLNRVGVSRKIADEGQRRRLRQLMLDLNPPKGLGFIVRTAGLERSKTELARDLAYLLRLWKAILKRIHRTKAPAPIYQESDMITRTIRDIFTSEIDTIWIDEPAAFERAHEFLKNVMPRYAGRLKYYDEKAPLFHKYGIEQEIAKIQRRQVPLQGGGSIVIDQTEALVAIDVNSGNFRVENDAERTAYEMNIRAAKEIARQLRLRDLGGVIVNDFIDMRDERHRRGVERTLREAVRRDRARTKILRISPFGIIEMTRQRIRPSLKRSVYEDCPHCTGAGVIKTTESMAIDVMRLLALAAHREDIRRVNISVAAPVANYLNNRKRTELVKLEAETNMTIHIRHEEGVPAEHLQIDGYDVHSSEIRLVPVPQPPPSGYRGR